MRTMTGDEIEVLPVLNGQRVRIRVRDYFGTADTVLTRAELEQHINECVRVLAAMIRTN